MKRQLANVVFIFAILMNYYVSYASEFRIKSMAQMTLILKDRNNQLNLYDFGDNPAWLVLDKNKSWLRFSFITNKNSGNFKRYYDPVTLIDLNGQVEGVKILDKNQTFYGVINYHHLRLNDVYQAINLNPYQEHPFRLADNTSGTINYLGPRVSFQYSKNIFKQKLFVGCSATYQIETGLKKSFPQPRTIYRYVQLGAGLAYRFSDKFDVGATFFYSNTQEFTEIVSPGPFETRQVIVQKFRGEKFFTESMGGLEQFTNNVHYQFGWQLHYSPNNLLESAMTFRYNLQNTVFSENRFQPKKDGTWNLGGYIFHWRTRLKLPQSPIRLGLSFDRLYFNDWAKHPDFPVLMGDDFYSENRIGIGISYEPLRQPLILGAEYHFGMANKKKNDFISRLRSSGGLGDHVIKLGAEYQILKTWKIRSGVIYYINKIDADLLNFQEFLPENKNQCLTLGLAYISSSIEVEVCGLFGQQVPIVNKSNSKRNQTGVVFSFKFYRD